LGRRWGRHSCMTCRCLSMFEIVDRAEHPVPVQEEDQASTVCFK
jgi:hypothetical protein